jgi:glycosyltransferase involved in cell wall biosynthesis
LTSIANSPNIQLIKLKTNTFRVGMQSLQHILAILPERSPSTVINVITPLTAMQEAGMIKASIRLQNEVTPLEVAAADVIVLCRNWHPVYRPIFELALRLQIPIVYDLDDYVLGAPSGSTTEQLFRDTHRLEMLEWLLRVSTLVRVHSPTLKEALRAYNSNIQVVWAAIDWSLLPPALPELSFDPVKIVYAAQKDTGTTLYPFMARDLQELLAKFGSRIQLHYLGYTPPELCGHPQVICYPFESDYATFFSQFTRAGYAIGLAPMMDDLFHNSKTNIKFRDYAAAGAVGIYASTPLYRDNGVVDGETGLLVSGEPESWLPALSRLIENPALIETIRQQAYEFVKSRYNFDVVSKMWLEHLRSLPARPSLSETDLAHLVQLRWSFTYTRTPDAPWVARLRNILREVVPIRWKLRYYDMRAALRKYFRF